MGYLLDRTWIWNGDRSRKHEAAQVVIGETVAAGGVAIEWWDADVGAVLSQATLQHPGGRLVITPPPFTGHLAFKLRRLPGRQPKTTNRSERI